MKAKGNEEEETRKLRGKDQELLAKYKEIKGGSGSQSSFIFILHRDNLLKTNQSHCEGGTQWDINGSFLC